MKMKPIAIDLNLDAGEDPAALLDGREARLYGLVDRISIACGGHAGDARSMALAVELAMAVGVRLGAHPSYPDRARFGRVAMDLPPAHIADFVAAQVGALAAVAAARGARLVHVKPHGALYHRAAADREVAAAVAEGVARVDRALALVGPAGGAALDEWRSAGFAVLGEGFADRAYREDGALVPRGEKGAVLADPEAALAQARRLLSRCDTLCVHGDNPAAEAILLRLQPLRRP